MRKMERQHTRPVARTDWMRQDMNQYNHGRIAGTLAKLPAIRQLRNGTKSIRLTIRNYPDPNDGPEYKASRRSEQEIAVGIYDGACFVQFVG